MISLSILGATGLLGRNLISLLQECMDPNNPKFNPNLRFHTIDFFASSKSINKTINLISEHPIYELSSNLHLLKNYDLIINFAGITGSQAALNYGTKALIIDTIEPPPTTPLVYHHNFKYFLQQDNKTLYLPIANSSIIASLLNHINTFSPVDWSNININQGLSVAGYLGQELLWRQTKNYLTGIPSDYEIFNKQVAFNLIPYQEHAQLIKNQVNLLLNNCHTSTSKNLTSEKIKNTTLKMNHPINHLSVNIIPSFFGSNLNIFIQFQRPINFDKFISHLENLEQVALSSIPTSLSETLGSDMLYLFNFNNLNPKQIAFCLSCDNLMAGLAYHLLEMIKIFVDNITDTTDTLLNITDPRQNICPQLENQ